MLPVNLPGERGFTGKERGRSLLLFYVSPPPLLQPHSKDTAVHKAAHTRSHTHRERRLAKFLCGPTVNFGFYLLFFLEENLQKHF